MTRRWFWLLLALAALVRVWALDAKSLWRDEADTLMFTEPPLIRILTNTDETNPPLYYALLHGWRRAFGSSETAVRSLSVVFGVLTIAATYWVGRLLSGPALGLAAMALMALMLMPVEAAQTARGYSLFLCLGVVSWGCLLRWLQRPQLRWAAAYVGASVLMSYIHPYWVFTFFAGQGYLAWRAMHGQVRWAAVLGLGAAVIAGALPWLIVQARQMLAIGQEGFWIPRPTLRALPGLWGAYLGGSFVLVVAGIGLAGWAFSHRGRHILSAQGRMFLLAQIACPIIVPFVLSRIGSPIFWPRYTILASAGVALLIAAGWLALPRRLWRVMTALVCGAAAVWQLAVYYPQQREDWRAAAAAVQRIAQPGDIIGIPAGGGQRAFSYYYDRQPIAPSQVLHSLIDTPDEAAILRAALDDIRAILARGQGRLVLVAHEQPTAARWVTTFVADEYPDLVLQTRETFSGHISMQAYTLRRGS